MLAPLLRRTFSVENALSNGIWGGVYALVYAAIGAVVPAALHAATTLAWPWLLVVGFAVFCLLSAGTLALWAHNRERQGLPNREMAASGSDESPAGIRIKGGRNNQADGNYVEGRSTGISIEDSPESSATRNVVASIDDLAYKGRLARHHQLGRERLEEIENARHQRHLPGLGGESFEKEATADAKRQEEWWTAEARELLQGSAQLSDYFDNPSRLRGGPPVGLGNELDRIAGLFGWRVGRLGEMLGWLEGGAPSLRASSASLLPDAPRRFSRRDDPGDLAKRCHMLAGSLERWVQSFAAKRAEDTAALVNEMLGADPRLDPEEARRKAEARYEKRWERGYRHKYGDEAKKLFEEAWEMHEVAKELEQLATRPLAIQFEEVPKLFNEIADSLYANAA